MYEHHDGSSLLHQPISDFIGSLRMHGHTHTNIHSQKTIPRNRAHVHVEQLNRTAHLIRYNSMPSSHKVESSDQFDEKLAAKTLLWIQQLPRNKMIPQHLASQLERIAKLDSPDRVTEEVYAALLDDGHLLGYVMACLDSGMCIKVQLMQAWNKPTFDDLEYTLRGKRIEMFLEFTRSFGIDPKLLFQADDLMYHLNVDKVLRCLHHVALLANLKGIHTAPAAFWMKKSST